MEKFLKQVILHVIPDMKRQSASRIAQCPQRLGAKKKLTICVLLRYSISTHVRPKHSKKLTNALKEIESNQSIFGENEQPENMTKTQATLSTQL